MAKKKAEDTINLDAILFKCRDILRAARNSGSFFEKRDMMLTLVFLRFIGEKYEDGVEKLRQTLLEQGLDPDDENIRAAFFDDATFGGRHLQSAAGGKMVYHHQYACTQAECSTGQCTSQHCGRLQAAERLLCGRHLYHTQPCRKRHQKADR